MGDTQLRAIDAQGLHQYCTYSNDDSMVIVLEAVMDHDVNGDALSEAVRQAEQRYTNFGCGLATTGSGLCYRQLTSVARAYEDVIGKRWRLGTSETGGRLYRVTHAGSRITASLHHGLADGRGAFEYFKTLLYYYLVACGHAVDTEGKIVVAGDAPANEDEYPCETHGKPIDKKAPDSMGDVRLFGIKEDYLDERGEFLCRHIEVTASAESALSVAHAIGVTVTSLLTTAVNRAIAATYRPEDELMLTCVTTDLRPFFGSSTLRNCSGIAIIAEPPALRSLPIEAEAQAVGQQLAAALTMEAALGRIGERLSDAKRYMATPVEELFCNKEAMAQEKRRIRASLGTLVTNVGVIDLPSGILRHVRSASFRIPSFGVTFTVAVSTCGDTLTMNITQAFENDAFARALAETLSQLGIPAQIYDRGLEPYDVLERSAVVSLG